MSTQPLKLPVVITVQGDQAQTGFNKLGVQLKNLEAGVGRFFGSQVSAVGGMLAGFFTVQALINGVQKVLQHGQEVIDRVSQFNSQALTAQTQLDAAKLRQDVAMASVLGPEIAAEAQRQQARLGLTGQVDAAAAQLALESQSATGFAKEQAGRFIEGDFSKMTEAGMQKTKEIAAFYLPELFSPDALYEAEERLRMAQAITPLPTPVAAGAPVSEQDAANAAQIRELQEAVRQLRAMNRTVGSN